MNEAQIRERLRQAVGEATYPANLSSRVKARLKDPTPENGPRTLQRPGQRPWLAGMGRTASFVAALIVVLLVAALVAGVHAWRDGAFNPHSAPAGHHLTIKQYQDLVSADQQALNDQSYNCVSFDTPEYCLPASARRAAAMQHWLGDLNLSQPPARFAALDALMRRDLALALSGEKAWAAAYRVKDATAISIASDQANGEVDTVGRLAGDITASTQGTIATYTGQVRLARTYLLACVLCQRLVSQKQVSCPATQKPSCVDEVAAVRLQVETFLETLVVPYAPDSIAAKDARLQSDLLAADVSIDAMTAALSAGDQVSLQAGHDALRQALNRVDTDAGDIAGTS
jgi:hypothetical protein